MTDEIRGVEPTQVIMDEPVFGVETVRQYADALRQQSRLFADEACKPPRRPSVHASGVFPPLGQVQQPWYNNDLWVKPANSDIRSDAAATLERSSPWLERIRSLGYSVAYVGQNGQGGVPVPWDDIDAFFIGGDDPWKLGPEAASLAAEAKRRGKWVHMGRVNSGRRWRYAERIGCDSVDGTFLRWPTTNLPRLRTWINASDQLDLFAEAAA